MSTLLRDRLKTVQALAIQGTAHPLMPAAARACIAETTLLLVDIIEDLERLRFYVAEMRASFEKEDDDGG